MINPIKVFTVELEIDQEIPFFDRFYQKCKRKVRFFTLPKNLRTI